MNQLNYYMVFEVVEKNAKEFFEQFRTSKAIDDVVDAHARMLRLILVGILLDTPQMVSAWCNYSESKINYQDFQVPLKEGSQVPRRWIQNIYIIYLQSTQNKTLAAFQKKSPFTRDAGTMPSHTTIFSTPFALVRLICEFVNTFSIY